MKITRYNYGSLLPSEDEIIAQCRDFGEHERSCNEVANILFPEIESLQAKLNVAVEALEVYAELYPTSDEVAVTALAEINKIGE